VGLLYPSLLLLLMLMLMRMVMMFGLPSFDQSLVASVTRSLVLRRSPVLSHPLVLYIGSKPSGRSSSFSSLFVLLVHPEPASNTAPHPGGDQFVGAGPHARGILPAACIQLQGCWWACPHTCASQQRSSSSAEPLRCRRHPP